MVKVKKKKQNIKKMQPQDIPLIRLIQKGPQALSNIELLTILLGKDVNWGRYKTTYELAQEIFQKYDIKRLSQASIGELDKIFGIGKIRAAQIQAIFELARRVNSYVEDLRPIIEKPEDVFKIVGSEMQNLEQEVLKVLLLDSRNRLIKVEDVFKGSLNESVFSAREIFKLAFDYNAASIILVHNHPSGDANPSNDDIFSTKDLIKAGNLVGIKVNDHIVIGNNSFVSMREKFKTLFEG
jgi:DNA repair protein RadC